MSWPEELNISFQYLGTNYNVGLKKGEKSDHSVEINGASYAVLVLRKRKDSVLISNNITTSLKNAFETAKLQ